MTKQTTLIYYLIGAYGTFIEWSLNYFSDPNFPEELPFLNDASLGGNSHGYDGYFFINEDEYNGYLQSSLTVPFTRMHPGTLILGKALDVVHEELLRISKDFNNIIIPIFDDSSRFWVLDNFLTKTELCSKWPIEWQKEYFSKTTGRDDWELIIRKDVDRIKWHLSPYMTDTDLNGFNINSIEEAPRWTIREILSHWLYSGYLKEHMDDTFTKPFGNDINNVFYLNISDLRDNYQSIIRDLLTKLDQPIVREDKFDFVYRAWIEQQEHRNKDAEVPSLINSALDQIDFTTETPLTLFDEARMIHLLREKGIPIRDEGIEFLPNNSLELHELIK